MAKKESQKETLKEITKFSTNVLIRNAVILVIAGVMCLLAGMDFKRMHEFEPVYEGNPSLVEKRMLSQYNPNLEGTAQDTPIYVLKGEEEGGSMLILGGTHGNETAGVLSAMLFVENADLSAGTIYVIPQADASAFTHTQPLQGYMDRAKFTLADGSTREFRMGTRLSNPLYQWPDPNYRNGNSGRMLVKDEVPETRNMNRNYPGDENGNLMEQACNAIYNMLITEDIDLLYDAHEASPTFARVDYLIAHEDAMSVGSLGVMYAMMAGVNSNLEVSGATSFGLTHRSLGDNTDTYCTLFETLNPSMSMYRSKASREMVVDGIDPNAVLVDEWGYAPSTTITEEGSSINKRTAIHMAMCVALAEGLTMSEPENKITFTGMPTYEECMADMTAYLHPVQN